ncbi:alpha-N-acetylglucosaminidase N-terminal domain-containing protein [Bacteroides fluxus]|jgi:alpha-N-acetylglucosaminidase
MLHRFVFLLLLSLFSECVFALQPLTDLVKRVMPGNEDKFLFELLESSNNEDIFEISAKDERVLIRGNSPVSIAYGLNWYLKYYCQVSISFCEDL